MHIRKNHLFTILFLSILFIGCKSSGKDQKISDQDPATVSNAMDAEKKSVENYKTISIVRVDNLRMREGADKKSQVINKLSEGSLLYGGDEKSQILEKVTLRGVNYNLPYMNVIYEGQSGWVYGGGIYKIYSELEADPFTGTFDNVVLRLSNLKGSGLSRSQEIMKVIKENGKGSAEWNDALYHLAVFYLGDILHHEKLYKLTDTLQTSNEIYTEAFEKRYNMMSNDLSKSFAAAGFKYGAGEGSIYPIIDHQRILNAIRGPYGESLRAYLNIKLYENNNQLFSDAALVVSPSDIVKHVVEMETFLKQYPGFVRNDNIEKELEYLHSVILHGTANTPAVSYQTKKLKPEFKDGWDLYLKTIKNGKISIEVEKMINKHS